MNTPLVHIPVPLYNCEQYLAETLDSYLQQTYPNWHAFLVDDASVDGTVALARRYVNDYPDKFSLITNETNLGLTLNCNKALQLCTAPLVAFGSGDDLMLPSKLELQVAQFVADPELIICYHNVQVYDQSSGKITRTWNSSSTDSRPYSGKASYVASRLIRFGTSFLASQSCMASQDALAHLCFDSRVPFASDWLLWVDLCLSAPGNVAYLPDVLATYRKHSGVITSSSIIYDDDQYVSLSIIEHRYPSYSLDVQFSRGRLWFQRLQQYSREGKRRLAIISFICSLPFTHFSPKSFLWLLNTFLPRFIMSSYLHRFHESK